MTRVFIGLIALAIFAAGSLAGHTRALGGEAGCCENGGCPGCGGNGCGDRCPRCGCCMVPVCHMTCDIKKETVHKYGCTCKWICLPPITPPACGCCCERCDNGSGNSNGNCEDCGCCEIRCVHKLLVCPVTKETPVRKCTVLWTCPKCGYGPCCDGSAEPATPMPAPSALALPPNPYGCRRRPRRPTPRPRRRWQPIAACKGFNAIDYFPYWKTPPPALVAGGRLLFCASRPRCLAFWNETVAAADKGLRLTRLHNNPCVPYTYSNMDRVAAVCAGCPTQLETRIPPTFWGN